MENVKDLLPIGSVVLLKDGDKRLMIYGVLQVADEDEGHDGEVPEEYDYIGVLYPEGNIGGDHQYLFYHKDSDLSRG